MAEVEETSGGGEEVECGLGIAASTLEDAAALAGPLLGLLEVEQESEPDGEVVIAQSAGTLLEVGFEMKDGVAVLVVTGAGDLAELLGDGVPFAQDEAGEDGLVELLVERKLAGEEAAVESGEGEFEVVWIEAADLFDGARGGAGAEAYVPHALDDGLDGIFGVSLGLFIGKGKEDVDVGVGEEILAAVTAQGEKRDVQGRLSGKDAVPHFDENPVDNGGAAADGGGAVARALTGLADKRHLPHILLPKIVNR